VSEARGGASSAFLNPLAGLPTVAVAAVGAAEGARPAAAALACAAAAAGPAALLVDLEGRPPRPTLLATASARELEKRLAAHLPRARVAARGQVCFVAVAAVPEGFEEAAAALGAVRETPRSIHVPAHRVQPLLDSPVGPLLSGALLRADLPTDRALTSLLARDLVGRGLDVAVIKRRLTWVAERRALFGTLAPGATGGPPASLVDRLLGRPESSVSTDRGRGFRAVGVHDA
jgi:hypothetical protein